MTAEQKGGTKQRKQVPPEPTTAELKALLGGSYDVLKSFLADNDDLSPEWKYYGAKIGWNFKLFLGKRNMCFIAPKEGCFTIAFILGTKAVEHALESRLSKTIKQMIIDGPQYPEGKGVRFEKIKTAKQLVPVQMLLQIKKEK